MNLKFGYTVLIILNIITIGGSIYGLFTKGYTFIIPLVIGIVFLVVSAKIMKELK